MAAKSCKDCERLQTDSTGSAPLRSSYQQPTKYDHYTNFQKFKQSKIEENYIKNRKDELTKFDSKFTDWKLDPGKIEASFDHFSTQDIARFRTQLRRYDRSVVDGDPDANNNDIDPSTRVVKKKVSLLTISRTPVQCPIAACERIIGVTSVLSHYLRDHNEEYGVQCEELYGGKRAVLIFNPICLDYGQNACMGVLAYGGVTGKRWVAINSQSLRNYILI